MQGTINLITVLTFDIGIKRRITRIPNSIVFIHAKFLDEDYAESKVYQQSPILLIIHQLCSVFQALFMNPHCLTDRFPLLFVM